MTPDWSRLRGKGVPAALPDGTRWNLFDPESVFPVAVLLQSALDGNRAAMSDYCRRVGVSLAPHGKTTMSPELFALQVRDGAWAITAANVYQADVMRRSGVPRVLIANEVTAPADIRWLADQVDAGFPIVCYVDSLDGVRLLEDGLRRRHTSRTLDVLVELGVTGGRAGARSIEDAMVVGRAAAASPALHVIGASGFEGIISATTTRTAGQHVDDFLDDLATLAERIGAEGLVTPADELIVSAGGSVFFDRVAARLSAVRSTLPVRVVIRSGCYLSHDDGVIDELSPLGLHPRVPGDIFRAALEVWAPVLSRPEPSRLIIGAGKRDVSTDGLLPRITRWVERGTRRIRSLPAAWRAVRVDDQHAYFDVEPDTTVSVGDLVSLGISHPCTTFDKWKVIWVVDDEYEVVDVVTTEF